MNNALKQYIDLYEQNRELIDKNASAPSNALRREAYRAVKEMKLPPERSENYRITSLEKMLAPDMGVNLARVPLEVNPADSFHCGVPSVSTAQIFMLNDICVLPQGATLPAEPGVFVGSLRTGSELLPEVVGKHLGRIADMSNPVVALNSLLDQDGLLVYVPRGVRLETPLQLVNILQSKMPLMAVRRMLIILEEGAEAKILTCDHTQNPTADFLNLQVIEIYCGAGSRLDLYDIEESTSRTSRLSALYLRQEKDSNVLLDGITLYNGRTRNEYYCTFAGENSELKLLGMAIEDKQRQTDTFSVIRHEEAHCHSDELFKYVVDDEAKGAFSGLIYVAPGSIKTEAYQSNRNLVGAPTAKMYSKPQLEIYNDDVKCSHGTAIGTLDELQLFYMRSRGLSEQQARLLLKQAFMADVIEGVRMPGLKERLHALIERRFAGADSNCASCHNCSHD